MKGENWGRFKECEETCKKRARQNSVAVKSTWDLKRQGGLEGDEKYLLFEDNRLAKVRQE